MASYFYAMKFTAIILAGGRSSRMGEDKALIPYLGKPLIRYAIELALNFTKTIIISSGMDGHKLFGFPVVPDLYRISAPIAGIHAGLKSSRSEWNLVISCDMPNISPKIIDYLLSKMDQQSKLVLPMHDGYIEPLCGFYHKSIIPVMELNFEKDLFSPLDLLGALPHRIIGMDDVAGTGMSFQFKNVNSRDDLL